MPVRQMAQECAANLAPYKHARMAGVELTPPPPKAFTAKAYEQAHLAAVVSNSAYTVPAQ